jgi:vacuolar-type H+-ATPase subunit C/Vma6
MSGGVAEYAALCARVRVKYSNLLSPAEMRQLADAADLPAFQEALKRTPYQNVAGGTNGDGSPTDTAAASFRRHLAAEASSVIRATPMDARRVVGRLHRRHEVANIKAVLRGVAGNRPEGGQTTIWSRIQPMLFPLGDFSSLPLERMTEAGAIPAAVELLRGTPYHEALAAALRRYSAEQSLFPLEVALDLAYWRGLWQEARKLAGEDHRQATRVVGALIDSNNLMWAIRYKVYKGISEEELINYTLSIGYGVRDSDIRDIAAGADIASVVRRLYPEIQFVLPTYDDLKAGLPQLEAELKRLTAIRCASAFLGNPFHVGLPLALLILQDLEAQDLTTILEAKATAAAAAEYQPFLLGLTLAA